MLQCIASIRRHGFVERTALSLVSGYMIKLSLHLKFLSLILWFTHSLDLNMCVTEIYHSDAWNTDQIATAYSYFICLFVHFVLRPTPYVAYVNTSVVGVVAHMRYNNRGYSI